MELLEKIRNVYTPGLEALVKGAYDAPYRKYHNWDHIEEIWNLFERDYASEFLHQDRQSFFYATVFHDIVYEVGNSQNELLSAQEMLKFFKLSNPYSNSQICEIFHVIVGSRNHWDAVNDTLPEWGKLFLDLDIYHLGSSKEKYQDNGRKLFDEFSSKFSETEIFFGREKWLKGVLANKKLYRLMDEDREKQARQNMENDLDLIGNCS